MKLLFITVYIIYIASFCFSQKHIACTKNSDCPDKWWRCLTSRKRCYHRGVRDCSKGVACSPGTHCKTGPFGSTCYKDVVECDLKKPSCRFPDQYLFL